ncbi:MAG: hypothetical protein CSB44_08610 [Gammaproteobacteria bacterium]|nr:MAG: hypothetical protein CSB44_08610 [Gammaproteobacteria bacterium]
MCPVSGRPCRGAQAELPLERCLRLQIQASPWLRWRSLLLHALAASAILISPLPLPAQLLAIPAFAALAGIEWRRQPRGTLIHCRQHGTWQWQSINGLQLQGIGHHSPRLLILDFRQGNQPDNRDRPAGAGVSRLLPQLSQARYASSRKRLRLPVARDAVTALEFSYLVLVARCRKSTQSHP